jgi:hypothetical protein
VFASGCNCRPKSADPPHLVSSLELVWVTVLELAIPATREHTFRFIVNRLDNIGMQFLVGKIAPNSDTRHIDNLNYLFQFNRNRISENFFCPGGNYQDRKNQ